MQHDHQASRTRLRLTPAEPAHRDASQTDLNRAVAAENIASWSSLEATDPRWVLAVQTQSKLDGSCLAPEKRDRLMKLSHQLGLRPFDANVIFSIVQDAARRGQPLQSSIATLEMVAAPTDHRRRFAKTPSKEMSWFCNADAVRFLSAMLCAVVATLFLIWWLIG